jgi:Domain of unknown function (DUF1932)
MATIGVLHPGETGAARAVRSATAKGRRGVAEMEEIAAAFAAAGQPTAFTGRPPRSTGATEP